MRNYDVSVIGGGFVGLWTAYAAAQRGMSVALLEKEMRLGSGTSSRNTGVLHAGVYYKPGSLKAKHCVEGRRLSLKFMQEHGVPFFVCGKYIVPTPAESDATTGPDDMDRLEALALNARQNAVDDIEIVNTRDKPLDFLIADRALHVPGTAIVDLAGYLVALERAARGAGVDVFEGVTCVGGELGQVIVRSIDGAIQEISSSYIVNSAGLYADEVARLFGCTDYEVRPNKGSYFQLRIPLLAQTLVYPLPSQSSTFLGVHYIPDLQGCAYAGPNSEWAANKADYSPDADQGAFFEGLSKMIRGYSMNDLIPSNKVGLRSRLFKDGVACTDFVIQERPAEVFHFLGIESPGLTAAPSLAKHLVHCMLQ